MSNALNTRRPDQIRARAINQAMKDSRGKPIRTQEQAETWIDEHKPELTDAWLSWVGQNIGK
jgi:hypothetical protein